MIHFKNLLVILALFLVIIFYHTQGTATMSMKSCVDLFDPTDLSIQSVSDKSLLTLAPPSPLVSTSYNPKQRMDVSLHKRIVEILWLREESRKVNNAASEFTAEDGRLPRTLEERSQIFQSLRVFDPSFEHFILEISQDVTNRFTFENSFEDVIDYQAQYAVVFNELLRLNSFFEEDDILVEFFKLGDFNYSQHEALKQIIEKNRVLKSPLAAKTRQIIQLFQLKDTQELKVFLAASVNWLMSVRLD